MITIIDYGLGNLNSVSKAFKRIGCKTIVSSNPSEIEKSKKVVLPGVGNFSRGIKNLNESGLTKVLNKLALDDKIPILGICLGMQLMTKHSEEGDVKVWVGLMLKLLNLI